MVLKKQITVVFGEDDLPVEIEVDSDGSTTVREASGTATAFITSIRFTDLKQAVDLIAKELSNARE